MNKNKAGFSLAEVLFLILIVGISVTILMPIFTQVKESSGVSDISRDCILTDKGDTSKKTCIGVIDSIRAGQKSKYNTLLYFVDKGEPQSKYATGVLYEACVQGAGLACDYFLDKCANGSCGNFRSLISQDYHPTTTKGDSYKNRLVQGVTYLKERIERYCKKNMEEVVAEILKTCKKKGKDSLACHIDEYKCSSDDVNFIIDRCNEGSDMYCKLGYEKEYNRTCKQIKNVYDSPKNGKYRLTYGINKGQHYEAYCVMNDDLDIDTGNTGGWTLALKADGNSSIFQYKSHYWENTNDFQRNEVNLDQTEHKSLAFTNVPFDQITLRLVTETTAKTCKKYKSCSSTAGVKCKLNKKVTGKNCAMTTTIRFSLPKDNSLPDASTYPEAYNSLLSLFSGGFYSIADDRKFWLNVVPGSKLDKVHYSIGINAMTDNIDEAECDLAAVRIGVAAAGKKNDNKECKDKWIYDPKTGIFTVHENTKKDGACACAFNNIMSFTGIGGFSNETDLTAGNYYREKDIRSFGYIFVR